MNEKIIIITSDETMELADYTGYKSLRSAVNGLVEHFHSFDIPLDIATAKNKTTKLHVDLYCNEEFLVNDSKEFDKINAVASLMSNQEIRGNVAMVVRSNFDENRGFKYKTYEDENDELHEDYCECSAAKSFVHEYITLNESKLKDLHKRFDNNKSEPYIEVIGGTDDDI